MSGQHTPGSWTVHEDPENPGSCTIYPEQGHPIGEEGAYFAPADARLIAASPLLLKELQHLVRLLTPLEIAGILNVPGLATLNGARAAIVQALPPEAP